jgi:hypothetical protein
MATFIQTAVTSTIKLSTPFLLYSSRQTERLLLQLDAANDMSLSDNEQRLLDNFPVVWVMLDACVQAMLTTNAPACRASIDQGRNLLRVAQSALFAGPSSAQSLTNQMIMAILQNATQASDYGNNGSYGHISTILGMITRLLSLNDIDAVRLYWYCASQDIVNAAVQLNFIGPMAGQALLLAQAQPAAHEGVVREYTNIQASIDKQSRHRTLAHKDRCAGRIIGSIHDSGYGLCSYIGCYSPVS